VEVFLYDRSSDIFTFIKIDDRIIHEDHTILLRYLEDRIHMMRLSSDDEISDRVVIEHHFTGDDKTSTISFREEYL
jgi:hypothetical protein